MSGSSAVSVKRSVAAILTVAAMGLATACTDDGRSGESVEDSGDSEQNTSGAEASVTPDSGWEPPPSSEPAGELSDADVLEIVQKADAGADLKIPDGVDWVSLVVDIGAGVEARWRVPGGMVTAARPIWSVSNVDDGDDTEEVNTVYFAGDNRGAGNDSDAGQGWVQPSVQLQPGQSVDLGMAEESDPLGLLYFDGVNLVHWGEEGSPEGQVLVLNPEEGFREVQLDQ